MKTKRLRSENNIDYLLIELLSRRGELLQRIREIDPPDYARATNFVSEEKILQKLIEANTGPYPDEFILSFFRNLFMMSGDILFENKNLLSLRCTHPEDTMVEIRDVSIGVKSNPVIIAGPCSVESQEQINQIAQELHKSGIRLIRGGAFKPRTSPYSFQRLGEEALIYLIEVASEFNLITVSEIMDIRQLEMMIDYVDILQIGSRNMSKFSLLKEVGKSRHPVLLKRGMSAKIDEYLFAAEYILSEGNSQVVLCKRGIRTFENSARNTIDITAVILLKQKSHLPMITDVSHSGGKRTLVSPLARPVSLPGQMELWSRYTPHQLWRFLIMSNNLISQNFKTC